MKQDYGNPYIKGQSLETSMPSFEIFFHENFMANGYSVFYLPHFAMVPDGATRINHNLNIYAIKAEKVILQAKTLNNAFGRGQIFCSRIPNPVAGVFNLINEMQHVIAIALPNTFNLTGSARASVVKLVTPQSFLEGHQVLLIPTGEFNIVMHHNHLGVDFVKNAASDTQDTEGVKA